MSDTETGAGDFAPIPLADIFSRDEPAREEPTGGQPAPEPEPQAPTETGDPPPAAPPAAEPDPPHVPIAALKDERAKRQQIEAELTAMKARLAEIEKATPQQPRPEPQPLPDPVKDPAGYRAAIAEEVLNERFNMSEMMARRDYPDLDEKLATFQAAAEADPALAHKLRSQPHPWDWMYQEAKRIQARNEIGDDPVAFRERVRAELMAELQGKPPAAAPVPPDATPLPTSLAAARSVGARTVKESTGPTPLNEIVRFKG